MMFSEFRPNNVLVIDINMPVMDNYRFLEEARTYPQFQNVPALMVSAETEEKDRQRTFKARANLFLVKLVKPDVFKENVKILLG